MILLAYPVRVIVAVTKYSKSTIQRRRDEIVGQMGAALNCPCGAPAIDPLTEDRHDIVPCERRSRRTRLLLRIIGRSSIAPSAAVILAPAEEVRISRSSIVKLSARVEQYVPAGRPVLPESKRAL